MRIFHFALIVLVQAGISNALSQDAKSEIDKSWAYFKKLEKAQVRTPYDAAIKQLDIDFLKLIDAAIEQAKTNDKEDTIPYFEKERRRIENSEKKTPLASIGETTGLLQLRLTHVELLKFEQQQAEARRNILRNDFIAALSKLEREFEQKGEGPNAMAISKFRNDHASKWGTTGAKPNPDVVALKQKNDLFVLPQFVGKGGRLKAIGEFNFREPVLPREVKEITDFVEVYAFHNAWVAVRKNGEAIIYAKIRKGGLRIRREPNYVKAVRGFDPWVLNTKRQFWRENEGKSFPVPASDPVGIVGNPTAAIAYWADGRVTTVGDGYQSGRLGIPPAGFFDGTVGAVTGGLHILAMTPDERIRGWDIKKRELIEYPNVSGVVEMEAGRDFAMLRKANGDVQGIYLDGRSGPDDERWEIPNEVQGTAKRVRAGEIMSAIQREDGSWYAWGPYKKLAEDINNIGPAIDLDLVSNSVIGYAIYIEPVESP